MHQPHHVSFAMDTAHSVSRDEPVSAPQAVRQRTLFDAHAEAGSVYVLGGPKHAPKPQPQLERPSLSKVYKHPEHSYRAPVRVLPAVDSRPGGVVNRFPSPPRTSSPPPAELDARMEAAVLTQYNDHLTHELESAQVKPFTCSFDVLLLNELLNANIRSEHYENVLHTPSA